MGIPRQSAQRRDRCDDHPVRAVLRHRPHGAARRIGEPAVGRRHRLRPGGRCHRHHGGEHLPASGRGIRASGHRAQHPAPHARPQRLPRQDGYDLHRRGRGQPVHILRRGHHHRGLRAAVHSVRHRRPHIRPDGQDLRLCHRRRIDRHLHDRPGLEPAAVSPGGPGARDSGRARPAPRLSSRRSSSCSPTASSPSPAWASSFCWRYSPCAPWDWNSCPSWKKETCGCAPPSRSRFRSRTATPTSIACAC